MKDNKKLIKIFIITMIVLFGLLWIPIFLAGPDGLERVLFNLTGNEDFEPESDVNNNFALFPDYEFPFANTGYFGTWIIGIIGSIITFVVIFGIFKLIKKSNKNE